MHCVSVASRRMQQQAITRNAKIMLALNCLPTSNENNRPVPPVGVVVNNNRTRMPAVAASPSADVNKLGRPKTTSGPSGVAVVASARRLYADRGVTGCECSYIAILGPGRTVVELSTVKVGASQSARRTTPSIR